MSRQQNIIESADGAKNTQNASVVLLPPVIYRDTIAENILTNDLSLLPRVVLDIWHSRPDLQAAYPCPLSVHPSKRQGDLKSWFFTEGMNEYLGVGNLYQFHVLQDGCRVCDLDEDSSLSVAIILPTKDRLPMLQRALQAVRAQSYPNWHLYLVDDSTDYSSCRYAEELLGSERVTALFQKTPSELVLEERVAAARNIGMQASQEDLIAHLDDDNCWHPHHLAKLVQPLREDSRIAMSFSLHRCMDSLSGKCCADPRRFAHNAFQVYSPQALRTENFIASDDVMLRRSVVESLGYFREDLPFYADWEYWCRIASQCTVIQVFELLTDYYIHDNSITSLLQDSRFVGRMQRRVHALVNSFPWS